MGFFSKKNESDGLKFIVVDDSSTMRKIIKRVIQQTGIFLDEIEEAENGEEALKKLKKNPADLILTDWNMPVMDGLEFVKSVKKVSKLSSIPILMITTETSMKSVNEAMENDVNDYLMKPFTPEQLLEKIKKWVDLPG